MLKIILHGCNGKMGRVINDLLEDNSEAEIVAGIDAYVNNKAHNMPYPCFSEIESCDMPADVIIDFTTASAVPDLLKYAVETNTPLVLCTTGLSQETLELISNASTHVAILKSANMSVGVNLISELIQKAAQSLADSNFDIEIIEKHHNQKIDAPSGTAVFLADSINQASENKFDYVYDRSQKREKRTQNEIGIHSIRGGTIPGEHSVIFAGRDEIIEITHKALSREIFAVGAIKAAKYLAGKPAGLYSMQNVIR